MRNAPGNTIPTRFIVFAVVKVVVLVAVVVGVLWWKGLI